MSKSLFAQVPIEAEACSNTTILTLHNKSTHDLIGYATSTSYFSWSYSYNTYLSSSPYNIMQNQTFGSGSLPAGNTRFDIYIDGTFTVDDNFEFFYCTIYLGPNAHIIINRGSRLDIQDCHLLCCHGASEFNMWKGITINGGVAPSIRGGSLKMNACLIEDAQIAVDAEDYSALLLSGNIFNRNTVGINLQGPTIMPNIINIGTLDQVSFISENHFTTWHFPFAFTNTTTASRVNYIIAAGPYSQGQLNNGIGEIGHTGIVINNMQPLPNNSEFILGTYQPQKHSFYQYLEYGIWNNNSKLKVFQSDFKDLHPNIGSSSQSAGTGIYTLSHSVATLAVGGINTVSATKSCSFDNCKFGILTSRLCKIINVTNNSFTNCTNTGIYHIGQTNGIVKYSLNKFVDCFRGIQAINTITPTSFSIDNNQFLKNTLAFPATNYSDNAIYVVNNGSSPIRGSIHNNSITDERIGIYTSNISNLSIDDNPITFNRDIANMLNEPHYGIWMDHCPNSTIIWNHINCTQSAVDPSTYKTLVRGLNLKAFGNSTVSYNEINHCGTAMRFVDNCLLTYMQCNNMDNNGTGWYLQTSFTSSVPVLSPQGTSLRQFLNLWSNTPTSCYKVDGQGVLQPFDYYHSGPDAPNNDISPNPYNPFILFDNAGLLSGTSFCDQQFVNDSLNDQELLNSYNDSILNVLSLDKVFRDIYFKLYKFPDVRSEEQTEWMLNHQFTLAAYNRLFNDTINRESILDDLNSIPTSPYAKLNEKKDLFYRALVNEIAGYDSLSYDGINLSELAWTNSWDGTEAVFLARAILGVEVDDQENNLRTAGSNQQTTDCGTILINNLGEITYSQFLISQITISDISGRQLFESNNTEQYNCFVSQKCNSGMYIVKINSASCSKVFKISRN